MKCVTRAVLAAGAVLAAYSPKVEAAADYVDLNEVTQSMFTFLDTYPCNRVITKTGAIGCGATSRDVDVGDGGALVGAKSEADLDALLASPPSLAEAITLVLDQGLMTTSVMEKVLQLNNAVTIVTVIFSLSEDPAVSTSNPDPVSVFNPDGDGLVKLALPFGVVLLRTTEDSVQVWEEVQGNLDRDLTSVPWTTGARFSFYNGPLEATSEFCLRLGECDPLGGNSVWGTVGTALDEAREVVMLTAGLDSTSFFHDLSFGRNQGASGIVTTLLAAKALAGANTPLETLERQISVALFQGEAWDHIGSRRFVSDIGSGEGCKTELDPTILPTNGCAEPFVASVAWTGLGLSNISHIFAVDQVADAVEDTKIFWHGDEALGGSVEAVADANLDAPISFQKSNATALPSSPLSSFLGASNWTGTGVVLTGFNTSFSETNLNYHSRFDRTNESKNEVETAARIAEVAEVIARSAFVAAGANNTAVAEINVDRAHAVELWLCFSQKFACPLVASTLNTTVDLIQQALINSRPAAAEAIDYATPPLFTGVYRPLAVENGFTSLVESFTHVYLAKNTRQSTDPLFLEGQEECQSTFQCMTSEEGSDCPFGKSSSTCIEGRCTCPYVYFHDALSPGFRAFTAPDRFEYTILPDVEDQLYTEPRWTQARLVLFRESSNSTTSIILLVAGLVATLSTWLIVSQAKERLANTKLKLQ